MTRIGIAGDWHGNTRWAVSVLREMNRHGIKYVYQLGDFGLWPGPDGEEYLQQVIRACEEYGITLWITPGNHEDYTQIEDPETAGEVPARQTLAKGKGWEVAILPRGWQWTLDGKQFLSFGGAPSIDREFRTEGKSWWPDEMIRDSDLLRLDDFDNIDVMLCHDSPDGGTSSVQAIIETPANESMWSAEGLAYAREGREVLNKAVDIVRPNWFLHGHYHVADYRYDSLFDRHYVSTTLDGEENNIGVLSWGEDGDEDGEMTFEFYGGNSWI